MMSLHKFANPARFMRLSSTVFPWLAGLTAALLGVGLIWGLFIAPADYQQGETVRIMYVHVPSAWMSMFIYGVMAVASAVGLIWRHPLADLTAKASAPIGAGFTAAALVTGALWGQPTWGTWWVWDARMTSVLVLLFLYLGYMALRPDHRRYGRPRDRQPACAPGRPPHPRITGIGSRLAPQSRQKLAEDGRGRHGR